MLKQWWSAFLDLIYPPKCPGCRKGVDAQGSWCPACLADVLAVREINLLEHHLTFLDGCWAICEYTGGVKRLIHDMKFRHAEGRAVHLTWLLGQNYRFLLPEEVQVVIPVPLHTERLKERGFNQTERIFHSWSLQCRLLWFEDCLIRSRPTIPQWELQLAARRANIKGAFSVTRQELVQSKKVLLVDDIVTSGITMNECARVLKNAGALKVWGLALASGA